MVLKYQLTNLQRLEKQVSLILSTQTIEVKHQFKYLDIIFQGNPLYNEHMS